MHYPCMQACGRRWVAKVIKWVNDRDWIQPETPSLRLIQFSHYSLSPSSPTISILNATRKTMKSTINLQPKSATESASSFFWLIEVHVHESQFNISSYFFSVRQQIHHTLAQGDLLNTTHRFPPLSFCSISPGKD